MGKAANSSISLKQIHVTDNFWNKYVHLVKDVIIPYQWDILNDKLEDVETSHCIENFKIAAGEKEGEFQGAVFQDTDVAKWLEAVGFVLNYERDEKLEELADETIELIGRAQQPDGYLNTYFTGVDAVCTFYNNRITPRAGRIFCCNNIIVTVCFTSCRYESVNDVISSVMITDTWCP